MVVSCAELDVSQYGVAKSVNGREIQEVTIIIVTLAPDTVVSVLTSAVGTGVPALGAVGDGLGDLMGENIYERVSDPVAVRRDLVGAVPGTTAFGDNVGSGLRISLNGIFYTVVKSLVSPRHESMEAADRGTVCGTVRVLVFVDKHIIRWKEIVEAIFMAPVKEDFTRYHVGHENKIFNIARVDTLGVIGRIHQEATIKNGIRWAISGIIPVGAKILIPG
jgi:hypothetical protein